MTEADRKRLGEERRLIFQNIANAVPIEDVMVAFRRSRDEIEREIAFVAKKIREYRFRRTMPPLECDDIRSILWNRKALLETLRKLGPDYLSSDLILPRIGIERIDEHNIGEMSLRVQASAQRVGARVAA